jgi:hypothetical protein
MVSVEAHDDGKSIIGTLAEAKLASVCPNDIPCDRKTQAGAARTFRMEWLPSPLPFRNRNPRSVVDDLDDSGIPVCQNPNLQTCLGAMLQGVVNQV